MPHPLVLLLAQPTSGGVARHVRDLAEGLAARDWVVRVGCPGEGPLAERLTEAGIGVESLPYVRSVSPRDDLAALAATRRLIARLAPAIVHCHSSKAGFLGRLAVRSLGDRNTVYTPHCLPFSVGGSTGSNRVYRLLEKLAAPWTGRFVAVADAEAAQIVAAGLAGPDRVRMVHNGIAGPAPPSKDTSRKLRSSWDANADAVVFATVGRADRQKAFDVFLSAALEADEYLGSGMARFVMVGGDYTTTGALDAFRMRVAEAGATDRVHVLGERDDVEAILDASDVLVMPSRWEAFPYVMLEAGVRGLPVVATPVGGVAEVVEDGVTGRLVAVDDASALAGAMRDLAVDSDARARMGGEMLKRARGFTLERMLDGIVAVYGELA